MRLPCFVWLFDDDDFKCVGHSASAGDRYARLTAKILGRSARQLFAARPSLVQAMVDAMGSGQIKYATIPCSLLDGDARQLGVLLAPQPAGRLLTVVIDGACTESPAAGEALLQTMLDGISVPIALVEAQTRNHRVVECNKALEALLGCGEARGIALTDLIPGPTLARVLAQAADDGTRETLDGSSLEPSARHPSISSQVIHVAPYPMDKAIPKYLLVTFDTQPQKPQSTTTDTPDPPAALANNFAGLLYRRRDDEAWTIESLHGQVEKLTGYDANQLGEDHQGLFELVHVDDRNHVQAVMTQALVAKQAFEVEYRLRHRSGRYRHVRDRGTPVLDVDGIARSAEGLIEDISRFKSLARRLERRLRTDPLTLVLNISELSRRIENLSHENGSPGETHALLYVDLDRFRVLNEVAGTEAGSQFLRVFARRLKAYVRRQDHVARVGGDRFAILLERCPPERARAIVEAVRAGVEQHEFAWTDISHRLTVSIGLITFGALGLSASAVMTAADQACNTAKELGRNRMVEYDPTNPKLRHHRSTMRTISEISTALVEDRFALYAQPIRTLNDKASALDFEVLLRMVELDGTLLAPGHFLAAAESFGLTPKLDRWVMRTALGTLTETAGALERISSCSINLSAHSLVDPLFLDFLVHLLEDLQFPSTKLCLEITETAVMQDFGQALSAMHTLRDLGCRFALDDFGSGMASFGYLRQLPVDLIKIDGAFVRNIAHDNYDLEIVKAVVTLAHASRKLTVAEHVEDEETLWVLRKLGVDYAQGYFIAKPLPLSDALPAR